jgi:protocatechuate 3,4-dioxygenase beta subunit
MLIAFILAFFAVVQAPPSLEGVVLKAGTSEPLFKAAVELRRTDSGDTRRYVVSTQKNGRFEFHNVSAGQYELSATHPGYVPAKFGEQRVGGAGIPIVIPSPAPTDIQLAMTPTGVISGRILDRSGQPLANATVHAMKVSYTQGNRTLSSIQSTLTNDLGEYRLFWLTPGRYYVGAVPTVAARRSIGSGGAGTDRLLEFRIYPETATVQSRAIDEVGTTVYFPGTYDNQNGTPIDVGPGAEMSRIDFIAAPVRTRHIRGVVVSSEPGRPLTGSPSLRIVSRSSIMFSSSPTTTFDLAGMLPGTYVLAAELSGMSGSVSAEVRDQDLNDIVIPISRGFSLSGQVLVEGATPSNPGPELQSLRLAFRQDPNTGIFPDPVTAGSDGSFVVQPLYSGNYRVGITPVLQNAYLKSIRFEGREVLASGIRLDRAPLTPLTVVISANPGIVTGTVVNGQQRPMPKAVVALVPEKDLRSITYLFKNVTTDQAGQFRIPAVTPGSYKLFAWEEVENGAWLNTEFMNSVEEMGTPVEIGESETKTLSLQAILP